MSEGIPYKAPAGTELVGIPYKVPAVLNWFISHLLGSA